MDDDPGIRTQIKWGIQGFEVITAETRAEAMQQLELHQPPLVTLDLGLPPDADGTSEGFAALREILRKAPHTQVIIVSASEDIGNAEKARSSGAYEYYPKPLELSRLQQILERAYKDYQAAL